MQVLAEFLENFHVVDRMISTIFEYPFQKPQVKDYLVPSSKNKWPYFGGFILIAREMVLDWLPDTVML